MPPSGLTIFECNKFSACVSTSKMKLTFSISAFVCFYSMTERELDQLRIVRFVTGVKEELLNMQLMRMNYVPMLSQDHSDSDHVSYVVGKP